MKLVPKGFEPPQNQLNLCQFQKLISILPATPQKLNQLDSHQASNSETILIQKQMRDSREWSMKGINMFSWDFSLFYWIPQFLPFNIDTGLVPLALVRLRLVSGFVTHFPALILSSRRTSKVLQLRMKTTTTNYNTIPQSSKRRDQDFEAFTAREK